MRKKGIGTICPLILAGILAGCSCICESVETAPTSVKEEAPVPPEWNARWVVYWDMDFEEEMSKEEKSPGILCLFACAFDDSGEFYFPKQFDQLREETADMPGIHYFSVTNDLICLESGQISQKDTAVLEQIFENEASMAACAEKLLAAAADYPGLEVDFENLKSPDLWKKYSVFLNILSERSAKSGKKVRIVLPCSAPVDTMNLPDAFSYSVMCYNLYGTHSGPGPKADQAFLEKTALKFRDVPNISFALATGGFVWDSAGKAIRSLTQRNAETLRVENGAEVFRDTDSGALHFTYSDGGETFTVWYADSETLDFWRTAVKNAVGENARFDLWRVGGNIFQQ